MLVSIVDDRSEIQLAATLRRAGYASVLDSDVWELQFPDGINRNVIGFHVVDCDAFITAFQSALPHTMQCGVDRTTGGARIHARFNADTVARTEVEL